MNKVYLVVGSTGEHSDYNEWNVAAYLDVDVAEVHVTLLNQWLKDNGYMKRRGSVNYRSFETRSNPYDPECQVYNSGTVYTYAEVPLFLHPDEFIEAMERGEL